MGDADAPLPSSKSQESKWSQEIRARLSDWLSAEIVPRLKHGLEQSVSRRFLSAGRMSRSTMPLRIDRVLSAIFASYSHRPVLAEDLGHRQAALLVRRRPPSATVRLASSSFSLASASGNPGRARSGRWSGVSVSWRPLRR